jgi:hypothetical protein
VIHVCANTVIGDNLTKSPDFPDQLDDYSVEQGVSLQSALLDTGESLICQAVGTGHFTNICSYRPPCQETPPGTSE